MAEIVNLTAISVGTNGEAFTVSHAGWTGNTTAPPYGTNVPLVTNGTTPNSVYNASTSSIAGMLYDTAPGSRNITVRVRMQRFGAAGSPVIRCLACATAGGDDFISARFRGDNWQVRIAKSVNGTVTTALADTNVTSLADTDYADLELRINDTGSPGSPSWQVSAWYGKNGAAVSQVGTTQTITDSVFDQIGRVGFMIEGAAQTTGVHITRIFAEDDTSSGGSSVTAAAGVATVSAAGASTAATTATAAAGVATVSGVGGGAVALVSSVFKNNTGTALASLTNVTAWVNAVESGALVVKLTSQTTNASGICTLQDAAIVTATQYRVTYRNEATGDWGSELVTST